MPEWRDFAKIPLLWSPFSRSCSEPGAGSGDTPGHAEDQHMYRPTDTLQGTCPAEEADAFPWEEELGSVCIDDRTTELDGEQTLRNPLSNKASTLHSD